MDKIVGQYYPIHPHINKQYYPIHPHINKQYYPIHPHINNQFSLHSRPGIHPEVIAYNFIHLLHIL
jgi:hypothetical protein